MMKKSLMFFLLLISIIMLVGCVSESTTTLHTSEPLTTEALTEVATETPINSTAEDTMDQGKITLLYSRSYVNFHDFDQAILLIDNYSDYVDSGYPLELDESYFDDYILYTFSFTNANLGTNIYVLDQYSVDEDNQLLIEFIHTEEMILVMPAFGQYAMIFSIDRALYDSVDGVSVEYSTDVAQEETTTSDMRRVIEMEPITIIDSVKVNEMVSLLYSKSNDFDEVIPFIDHYSDYLESDYNLELDEAFFEDHVLVSYTFISENIGENLYLLEDCLISEDFDLLIQYANNQEMDDMYPASSEYVMIFAIDQILYDLVDEVVVELVNDVS